MKFFFPYRTKSPDRDHRSRRRDTGDAGPRDVKDLLMRLSLGKYVSAFQSHEVDLEAFVELNEEDLVSISLIFYARLYHSKVLCADFLSWKLGFVVFCQKNIGAKAARKRFMISFCGQTSQKYKLNDDLTVFLRFWNLRSQKVLINMLVNRLQCQFHQHFTCIFLRGYFCAKKIQTQNTALWFLAPKFGMKNALVKRWWNWRQVEIGVDRAGARKKILAEIQRLSWISCSCGRS